MRLIKLCKYFNYIKLYFNILPTDIQTEILENMENYYDLARIARRVYLFK